MNPRRRRLYAVPAPARTATTTTVPNVAERIRANKLPLWCGRCIGPKLVDRYMPGEDGFANPMRPCPDCHPDAFKRRRKR